MPSPTPLRFEPREALPLRVANSLPTALQIPTTPIYFKSLILRLLTGTINIECQKTSKIIKQRNNYSTLTYTRNLRAFQSSITLALPCSLVDYNTHVSSTINNNFSLYRDIYFEFCGYFFLQKEKNELGAFVHLYRILERMAYCLPLIWAAKAKDYKRSFSDLREYFNNPKVGELKVLQRFVKAFVDDAERQIQLTLNITSLYPDWQERYYKVLFNLLDRSSSIISSTPYSQIVIQFDALLSLMINIRNRYFHALTGDANNFDCEQIVDGNEFFAILNEHLANWLSFLLFKVFEYELK